MDRHLMFDDVWHNCIPHTRGDGPIFCLRRASGEKYSPHAWGWTAPVVEEKLDEQVFPTRVGMDRYEGSNGFATVCIPHTRGDGPSSDLCG